MGFTSELEGAQAEIERFYRKVLEADANLISDDTRAAVEDDLPEAIGFIRSSTVKMDRLINAILKLSREGRRVLAPEPIDMSAAAGGSAPQRRASAPGAGRGADRSSTCRI